MNIAYLNQGNNNKSKKKLSNEQIKFSTKYLLNEKVKEVVHENYHLNIDKLEGVKHKQHKYSNHEDHSHYVPKHIEMNDVEYDRLLDKKKRKEEKKERIRKLKQEKENLIKQHQTQQLSDLLGLQYEPILYKGSQKSQLPYYVNDDYTSSWNTGLTEGTHIISDHPSLKVPLQQSQYIVSSRDRDLSIFPNAYEFQIKFNEPIRNIRNIKLMNFTANLERRYLIHSYNNSFNFIYNGTTYNVTLDEGDYDLVTLNNTLNSKLITAFDSSVNSHATIPGSITISSEINEINEKLVITYNDTSNLDATITFPTTNANKDSLAYIFGFTPNTNYTLPDGGTLTSPYRVNYIKSSVAYLTLNDFDNFKNSTSNQQYQRRFGIINIDKDYNKYRSGIPITKFFKSTYDFLDRITISLIDNYGNPYNLQDGEIILSILVEYEVQKN